MASTGRVLLLPLRNCRADRRLNFGIGYLVDAVVLRLPDEYDCASVQRLGEADSAICKGRARQARLQDGIDLRYQTHGGRRYYGRLRRARYSGSRADGLALIPGRREPEPIDQRGR